MGLDQYLEARQYFSGYDFKDDTSKRNQKVLKELEAIFPELDSVRQSDDSMEVKCQVGRWRKANQIHKWFVDNRQGGDDEQRSVGVSRESLVDLRKTCQAVLGESHLEDGIVTNGFIASSKTNFKMEPNLEDGQVIIDPSVAELLLPTKSGFFFGSTDYDEGYIDDVKATIEIIDRALRLPDEWSFYYDSSW